MEENIKEINKFLKNYYMYLLEFVFFAYISLPEDVYYGILLKYYDLNESTKVIFVN